MEILALLLLGLIAMLAIVPPIIRGKIEDSPMATTESFQRSMKEMGDSLGAQDRTPVERYGRESLSPAGPVRPGRRPGPRSSYSRNRALLRRNRVMASLLVLASLWGVATLISGAVWCLVLFAISCFLLVAFWGLTIIVPRAMSARSESGRIAGTPHYQRKQAM